MDPRPIVKDYSISHVPSKTDVLLIGSGYTSVVTAIYLAKAGVKTVVIDKGEIGSEASSKNGGMVLTGLSVSFYKILKQFGKDKLKQYFAESLSSIDCVEQLVNEGQIDCDFLRCGHFEVAYKPSHFDGLKEEAEFLEETLGHQTSLVFPEKMQEELASESYHGGLIDSKSASVQPAKYMAGLVALAEKVGVEFSSYVEAALVKKINGRFEIITNMGVVKADNVVIGTNGYTTLVSPWLKKRIVPVESFMIATEKLPDGVIKTLIPNNRMVFDTKRFLYYFRLSPDRQRILFGGRPRRTTTNTKEKADQMKEDLLTVFPQLDSYKIDYAWGGKIGFTVSRFPMIGVNKGIYYAMGYCGHGVAMATYLGSKLSRFILENKLDTVFAENKAFPIPFNRGNPWFLPIAHNWFRLMDRIS